MKKLEKAVLSAMKGKGGEGDGAGAELAAKFTEEVGGKGWGLEMPITRVIYFFFFFFFGGTNLFIY